MGQILNQAVTAIASIHTFHCRYIASIYIIIDLIYFVDRFYRTTFVHLQYSVLSVSTQVKPFLASFSAHMKYRLTVMTEIEEYRFNQRL